MKTTLSAIVTLLLVSACLDQSLDACTVAVVSGKCTRDGRPLLWKHRDTDKLQNALMYFQGGKYSFIGLIDAADSLRENVWVGCNSAGFAIMNSASYNLILNDTVKVRDREGIVMRMALERCATIEEFEALLRELPKPLGVEANFGVIDASGGAAFFEVANYAWSKLDVNDPAVAPFGYLLHTNFSFTGDPLRGAGHIRYATAEELFHEGYETDGITPQFILQNASRCLKHSLTRVDLRTECGASSAERKFVPFEDFIPRFITSASVVIQGVRPHESPDLTTMWTILGFPLTSVVTPVWIGGGNALPLLLTLGKNSVAPLCDKAMKLKESLFPIRRSYGERYLNINAAFNGAGTGTMQRLRPLEDQIFQEAASKLGEWRRGKLKKSEIAEFYRWMDETITAEYQRLYGL